MDGATEPVPILSPPGKALLPPLANAAVIELPHRQSYVSVAAMYRSIFHRQPLVNGYSGHFPPHYTILTLSLARGDTSALSYLARRRPLVIIINDLQDPGHGYRKMVQEIPGDPVPGRHRRRRDVPAAGAGRAEAAARRSGAQPPPSRDAGEYLIEFDLGRVRTARRARDPAAQTLPGLRDAASGRDVRRWTGVAGSCTRIGPADSPSKRRWPIRSSSPYACYLPGASGRFVRVYPASDWMAGELVVRESR